MLGASVVRVFERRPEGLAWLTQEGEPSLFGIDPDTDSLLAMDNGAVTSLRETPLWLDDVPASQLSAVTMRSVDGLEGLLVVGWRSTDKPGFADSVLPALAALALVGVDRRSLGAELDFERRVRAEVMDSLPIAISVFAGDPPRLIHANRAERELLGLRSNDQRPEALTESQEMFQVRFEDGTPLDDENAPVIETMRTGRSAGPFYLRIKRTDGTEVVTRTHCAPVRDGRGLVVGAVVTSESITG
jgi:PAS domain-containing protein